jgi:predicted Zn-dependent peptidase
VAALAAVLSRRMGDVLREKRGLSYSLGADAAPLGVATLLTAGMGVLPDQVEQARAGLREVTLSLMSAPPTQQEVDDAVRSAAVRASMRGLSRINRAYQRGMDEMRRDRLATSSTPYRQAASAFVSAEEVVEAARVCFQEGGLSAWVEAVVKPEAAP